MTPLGIGTIGPGKVLLEVTEDSLVSNRPAKRLLAIWSEHYIFAASCLPTRRCGIIFEHASCVCGIRLADHLSPLMIIASHTKVIRHLGRGSGQPRSRQLRKSTAGSECGRARWRA